MGKDASPSPRNPSSLVRSRYAGYVEVDGTETQLIQYLKSNLPPGAKRALDGKWLIETGSYSRIAEASKKLEQTSFNRTHSSFSRYESSTPWRDVSNISRASHLAHVDSKYLLDREEAEDPDYFRISSRLEEGMEMKKFLNDRGTSLAMFQVKKDAAGNFCVPKTKFDDFARRFNEYITNQSLLRRSISRRDVSLASAASDFSYVEAKYLLPREQAKDPKYFYISSTSEKGRGMKQFLKAGITTIPVYIDPDSNFLVPKSKIDDLERQYQRYMSQRIAAAFR